MENQFTSYFALILYFVFLLNIAVSLLLISKLNKMSERVARMEEALRQLDEVTNDIAGDMQRLKDAITENHVTDAQIERLNVNIRKLQLLGTDGKLPEEVTPETETENSNTETNTNNENNS